MLMETQMPKLLVATANPGKRREIAAILGGFGVELVWPEQAGGLPVVPEEGDGYQENALAKARAAASASGLPALAEDSGLEVEALGGRPGPRSARLAGPKADDQANNRKLLKMLEGVPWEARACRYVCVAAIALPDGRVEVAQGECRGRVGFEPRGSGGFGYDPLFVLEDRGCTMAQLPAAEKDRISHRGRALARLLPRMLALLGVRPGGEGASASG
ncbi:MAG: RdgB/HAM1 family non-canonical purine NTP pyrophosphatase [Acetobacteraceae bacterium]|nr:RdgB/HAM1 family non-canonical purine NTP pyrophosphatase [Acetobacteraceae bacterium]